MLRRITQWIVDVAAATVATNSSSSNLKRKREPADTGESIVAKRPVISSGAPHLTSSSSSNPKRKRKHADAGESTVVKRPAVSSSEPHITPSS
jgi:hypothetical protein